MVNLSRSLGDLSSYQNTLKENDELLKQVEQAILNEAFRGEL